MINQETLRLWPPKLLPAGGLGERNRDGLCILLLCAVVLLTWVPRFRGPIDLRWDAGVYYVLGTSLANGQGYRLLNEPGDIQAIQYPPGLPAIVALHQLILRTDDPVVVGTWIRRSWCLLSLLYIVFAFLMGRAFLSRSYALLLALTCLFNYEMYFMAALCYAELPFAFASTLFGYLYFRNNQGPITKIGTALAAIASYLIRTIGAVLLIAWVADAALRKQFRIATMRAAIAILPVVLWQSYVHSVESSESYKHPYYAYQRDPSMFYNVSYATNIALKYPFHPQEGWATKRDILNRFIDNLVAMPATLGETVTAKEGFWEGHLIRLNKLLRPLHIPWWPFKFVLVLLGLVVLVGTGWMLWNHQYLIPLYVLLTLLAISATCSTDWVGQFPRYLAAAEPFLLLPFLTCLIALRRLARLKVPSSRIASMLPLAIALLVVCESALSCVVGYRNFRSTALYNDHGIQKEYTLFHYGAEDLAAESGLQWLVTHAAPRAIVVVSMPHWVYLKTGLKSIMAPLDTGPQKTERLIDAVPATYVILDQFLFFNKQLPVAVRNFPEKWRLVYASPGANFDIYQRMGLNPTQQIAPIQPSRSRSLRF